jgi:hypothetical protein
LNLNDDRPDVGQIHRQGEHRQFQCQRGHGHPQTFFQGGWQESPLPPPDAHEQGYRKLQ